MLGSIVSDQDLKSTQNGIKYPEMPKKAKVAEIILGWKKLGAKLAEPSCPEIILGARVIQAQTDKHTVKT